MPHQYRMGYMIGLKHVISIARNSGALPFNPFAGTSTPPRALTGAT